MAEELLFRKDVKKELTWDLSLIYKDEDALMADAAAYMNVRVNYVHS